MNEKDDKTVNVRESNVAKKETKVASSVRVLIWLVVVLIVISIGNFSRTFVNQTSTDRATEASNAATAAAVEIRQTSEQGRDASLETLAELRAILATLEASNSDQPDLNNQAILDALQAIARIEAFVCGGTCPEPG